MSFKWQVAQIPGKGEGLVATRDLKAGEIFLQETPTILLSKTEARLINVKEMEDMKKRFGALPIGQRDEVLKLHSRNGLNTGDKGLELDIFYTNSVQCGKQGFGLFLNFSKINHSCNPNANHFWIEDSKKKASLALRDIKKGEELTICYGPHLLPRDERRDHLLRHYHFICMCETCSLDGMERVKSDRARKLIGEVITDHILIRFDPERALNMVRIAERLFVQENLILGRCR